MGAAADVLRSFASAFVGRHLAIIGGAVPSLLVETIPSGIERHVGTADLDLHLGLHLMDGETLMSGSADCDRRYAVGAVTEFWAALNKSR
ncbi:MAG: hypothetical protein ABIP17_10630 [Ilumatobacteraceae bacterium]